MELNWEKIKAEYIAGGTSYQKLCDKYEVSFGILRRVAERGKWTELKAKARQKADTKLVNAISNDLYKHDSKINTVADKLLDKIVKTLDEIEILDSQSIKHFTSALKDIKDIKGIKSDIDYAEQQARIDKLRKDAKEEQTDTDITVTFEEDIDKYGN